MKSLLTALFVLLSGCSMLTPPIYKPMSSIPDEVSNIIGANQSAAGLEMLAWLGGIAVLGGLALLVVTTGRRGWYPFIAGVGLILLNWVVLSYAHALFIPVVISTGALTLALGYKTVSSILTHRKHKNG